MLSQLFRVQCYKTNTKAIYRHLKLNYYGDFYNIELTLEWQYNTLWYFNPRKSRVKITVVFL